MFQPGNYSDVIQSIRALCICRLPGGWAVVGNARTFDLSLICNDTVIFFNTYYNASKHGSFSSIFTITAPDTYVIIVTLYSSRVYYPA